MASKLHLEYKLKKEPIGKGSFSTVYLASNKSNNYVAIKQISLSKITPNQIDKFIRELDISIKLDHPNIVKCSEVFKTEKHWYIVNEYCECGTLQDLPVKIKNFEYKQREIIVKRFMFELKDALHYLIDNNIIHRDIKPANILLAHVDNRYVIKLADFGFARYFCNEITSNGYDDMVNTICGSPIYMAPELLIDIKYNMKADLWSFGVIMYEMLYGVNPFCFPKNIPELRKLIKEKQICYYDFFSDDCIKLMKGMLTIEPENRIDWHDFFSHKWFNEANKIIITSTNLMITSSMGISMDVLDNDIIHIPYHILCSGQLYSSLFGNEDEALMDIVLPPNKNNKKDDDLFELGFEFIDTSDVDEYTPNYKTYHEYSTYSIIKIISNSVKYMVKGFNY